ncbi:MAG: hypothetical protein RR388_09375 [Rikenellaceae bacterium]
MDDIYSENEPINEDLPDEVLFHNHVIKGDDDLISIDNLLKDAYKIDL